MLLQTVLIVFKDTLIISGFVFIMMLAIEYLNVQTRGDWQSFLVSSPWTQYLFCALMGAVPGCLGSFAVVTLYTHRIVSFGAVITTMIATIGDEAFVMLALFPGKAVLLTVILVAIGIVSGVLTDLLMRRKTDTSRECAVLPLHPEYCNCFVPREILPQIRRCSLERFLLIVFMILALVSIGGGYIISEGWGWERITLFASAILGLFIVVTVPDHFLQEHLWDHVAKKHLPNIFLWTFGSLLVIELLMQNFDIEKTIGDNYFVVLLVACLVGLIPESGPHLIFVSLYAEGLIPFSVLLASSIVQDGHGMLPMLAHSRRIFAKIKIINFAIAFIIGAVCLFFGF
ncbi:MAG: putative manganese transporter [Candidatus Neomarinimicrobiota bacterium]